MYKFIYRIGNVVTNKYSPASILHQWQSELNVHAPGLKGKYPRPKFSTFLTWHTVLHYRGIRKQTVDLAVDELLQYDVVLTTYDVLSSEIYFATSTPDRNLRQEVKRYTAKKSPLVGISWWRM